MASLFVVALASTWNNLGGGPAAAATTPPAAPGLEHYQQSTMAAMAASHYQTKRHLDEDDLVGVGPKYGRMDAEDSAMAQTGSLVPLGGGQVTPGSGGGGPDKEKYARENHCEIERRRRNKMSAYITELSDMVPTCNALARKPDKLTILRMAVAHIKSLRGITSTPTQNDTAYKPSFLTDNELKHLILEAADGFLFVVSCDVGRIIYVSDSVTPVLNHSQADWFGSSMYDHVHPEDSEKVREQLSTQDTQNNGRILDLKTGTVKKEGSQSSMRLCMGSRRGFICRMRLGNVSPESMGYMNRVRNRNMLGQSRENCNYAVVHCTGYIKNWPPQGIEMQQHRNDLVMDDNNGMHGSSTCCLVAIGRLQVTSMPNTHDLSGPENAQEFVSRHNMEGKFSFVDQRVINLLGYSPQELLGKTCFDFIHTEDQAHMKDSFDQVVKMKGQVMNFMYRFRVKAPGGGQEWMWLRTSAFAFLNPYTDDIEYVVCTNSTAQKSNLEQQPATTTATTATTPQQQQQQSEQYRDYNNTSSYSHQQPPTPSSSQQQYSYDPTPSPVAPYGSPGTATAAMTNTGRTSVGKNSGTPTPPQSAWQQQQVHTTEAYHYSNLSPSRSPSGAYRTAAPSTAASSVPSSMWHWQGNGQASGLELGHSPSAPLGAVPVTQAPGHQHELVGDMLHMLGHHHGHHAAAAAAATPTHGFENLGGMFTGQFQ